MNSQYIYFTPGSNSCVLSEGEWSEIEAGWVWSLGYKSTATITLEKKITNKFLRFRFYASCLKSPLTRSGSSVRITVNGIFVDRVQVDKPNWYELVINTEINSKENISVEFETINPKKPATISDSKDERLLGIRLKAIELQEFFDSNLLSIIPNISENSLCYFFRETKDPLGCVFKYQNHFVRSVYAAENKHFQLLQQTGLLDKLEGLGYIPKYIRISSADPRYSCYLVTQTGEFIPHYKYPLPMLVDVCKIYLDINLILNNYELCLIDGHAGNFVVFDNNSVKWIDIGSIRQVDFYDGNAGANGLYSFLRHFYIPLLLMMAHPSKINSIRNAMRVYAHIHEGIPDEVIAEITSLAPSEAINFDILRFFSIKTIVDNGLRSEFIKKLLDHIKCFDFSHVSGYWSSYYFSDDMEPDWTNDICSTDPDFRYAAIQDAIIKSKCSTFVDFASNKGRFSLIAVKNGLTGIAVDYDEKSVALLHKFLENHPEINLKVAQGSFPDNTHKAELVLALAITHHLSLTQGFTFDQIAKNFREICSSTLITEFMPFGIGGIESHPEPVPNPLPSWYSLDGYINALKEYFCEVNVINYDRPFAPSQRVLIVCKC